jgi:uncharacterized protein Yka (UPF0111/DUF47 family)
MALFKKEKEVIELIIKHLDVVEDCAQSSLKAGEFYLQDEISQAKDHARKSQSLESEADLIRHDIHAAEACCDFFLNQRPAVPTEMGSHFLAVTRESLGIIVSLKLAVLCYLKGDCKIETVRDHTREIGLQESRVDKLEWDLTKQIFTSEMDFAHRLHLKLCLDSIVEVSDRAEDAGDQLMPAISSNWPL